MVPIPIKNPRKPAALVANSAYVSRELYDNAEDIGAKVIVPPIKNARVNKSNPKNRNRTDKGIKQIGRRRCKKEFGCHRQGKVENTFFRFKKIIGGRLRSRCPEAQKTEAILACNILNRMFKFGESKPRKRRAPTERRSSRFRFGSITATSRLIPD